MSEEYVLVVECITTPKRGTRAISFGITHRAGILTALRSQGYEEQVNSPNFFRRRAKFRNLRDSKANEVGRDEMLARIVRLESFAYTLLDEVIK